MAIKIFYKKNYASTFRNVVITALQEEERGKFIKKMRLTLHTRKASVFLVVELWTHRCHRGGRR